MLEDYFCLKIFYGKKYMSQNRFYTRSNILVCYGMVRYKEIAYTGISFFFRILRKDALLKSNSVYVRTYSKEIASSIQSLGKSTFSWSSSCLILSIVETSATLDRLDRGLGEENAKIR